MKEMTDTDLIVQNLIFKHSELLVNWLSLYSHGVFKEEGAHCSLNNRTSISIAVRTSNNVQNSRNLLMIYRQFHSTYIRRAL